MSPIRSTRTRMKSSSTQPYSIEQYTRTIDDLFRRGRNPSVAGRKERGSTPAGSASDSARSASEDASGDASGSAGGASGEIPIVEKIIPIEWQLIYGISYSALMKS